MPPVLTVYEPLVHDNYDPCYTRRGSLRHENNKVEKVFAIQNNERWELVSHTNFLMFKGEHKFGNVTYKVYEEYSWNLTELLDGSRGSYEHILFEGVSDHPSETLIGIFSDIFEGLNHLKFSKLEYGDLSTDNVFITEHGSEESKKLTAKLMGVYRGRKPDMLGLHDLIEKVFKQPYLSSEAKDLLGRFRARSDLMLELASRYDWTLLLRHPLFYDQGLTMRFIERYSDFINSCQALKSDPDFQLALDQLSQKYCSIDANENFQMVDHNYMSWGWARKFSLTVRNACENSRGNGPLGDYYINFRFLIRFYRNTFTHYYKSIEREQGIYTPAHIISVFKEMRRVHPDFVMDIYRACETSYFLLQDFLIDKQYMGFYFVNDRTRHYSEFQKDFDF